MTQSASAKFDIGRGAPCHEKGDDTGAATGFNRGTIMKRFALLSLLLASGLLRAAENDSTFLDPATAGPASFRRSRPPTGRPGVN